MGRNRYLHLRFYGSGLESPSLAFVRFNLNAGKDWITLVAHGIYQQAKSPKIPRVDEGTGKIRTAWRFWGAF
jgi:hypothetical protein